MLEHRATRLQQHRRLSANDRAVGQWEQAFAELIVGQGDDNI
jgi:hypothetical protein